MGELMRKRTMGAPSAVLSPKESQDAIHVFGVGGGCATCTDGRHLKMGPNKSFVMAINSIWTRASMLMV